MTHFQVTIQLPLRYNLISPNIVGEKIEQSKFKETYDELLKIGGGITINPTPFHGAWIEPKSGIQHDDENVVWSMLIESEDKITALKIQKIQDLIKYKEILKERFQQKEIYMVATRCTWL